MTINDDDVDADDDEYKNDHNIINIYQQIYIDDRESWDMNCIFMFCLIVRMY